MELDAKTERRGYASLTNDYMFKNMSHLRERPKVFDEKEFDRLFEIAELCNFTPGEYYDYQNSQKMIYDYENTIDFAKKQGEIKGREEGREEERFEIAGNLLTMGLPVEQIISATGLSEDQVRDLLC